VEILLNNLEKRAEKFVQQFYFVRNTSRQSLDLPLYKSMIDDLGCDPLFEITFVQIAPVFMAAWSYL